MAPERTPGPGGFGLPGMRRFTEDDGPSRDEVRQRIHSLYDRAETDSGTFNATRAAATGMPRRTNPVLDKERRRADPVVDDVARQWFESARLRLGPTVPAALPRDRMPDSPAPARSSGPASAPGTDLVLREPGLAERPVRELTAGPATRPVAELTATVGQPAARLAAEPTAGPVAALPAAPEKRPGMPQVPPAGAVESGSSTPRTAKERTRQKLGASRDLLARHAARRASAPLAIESPPATDAMDTWRTAEGQDGRTVQEAWRRQQPSAFDLDVPAVSPGAGPSATVPTTPFVTDTLTDALTAPQLPPAPDPFLATRQAFPTTEPLPAAPQLPTTEAFPTAPQPFPTTTQPFPTTTEPFPTTTEPFPAATEPFPTTTEPFPTAETFPGTGLPLGIGGTQEPGYDTKSAKAVAFARAQIGRPCLWGAAGPESYDAAGLTQAAWKAAGVTLPRAARDQSAVGTAVSRADIQPGDLVFFNPDAGHVGVCTGNGMMIHAPGPGAFIREEAVLYAGEAAIHSVMRPA